MPPFFWEITRLEKGDRHPDKCQDDKNNDDFHAIHEAVIEAQMRLSLLVKTARIHVNRLPRLLEFIAVVMTHGRAEINL